ncbi:hypothetical protein HOD20_04715 [archaeon]|jgi:hypothetical protein|nr:hypothetical protein [archaeon]MBT4351809.1 hypothetical protein [archaeon]MBT4647707.1 hypothetical protein [archaeon]MBT6822674.1 hypothetical protein [archaeon]MBT7392417.1 hypothetical protein [archaeon]
MSQLSLDKLKIKPTKNYITVQSNKKTIFIKFDKMIRPETIFVTIKGSMLVINVKKE